MQGLLVSGRMTFGAKARRGCVCKVPSEPGDRSFLRKERQREALWKNLNGYKGFSLGRCYGPLLDSGSMGPFGFYSGGIKRVYHGHYQFGVHTNDPWFGV